MGRASYFAGGILVLLSCLLQLSATQGFESVPTFLLNRYPARTLGDKDTSRMSLRQEALTPYLSRREMLFDDRSPSPPLRLPTKIQGQRSLSTRSVQENVNLKGKLSRTLKNCKAVNCGANIDRTLNTLMQMMEMGRRKK